MVLPKIGGDPIKCGHLRSTPPPPMNIDVSDVNTLNVIFFKENAMNCRKITHNSPVKNNPPQ